MHIQKYINLKILYPFHTLGYMQRNMCQKIFICLTPISHDAHVPIPTNASSPKTKTHFGQIA